MALTPWEQHEWFLITQAIDAQGGLADPEAEARAAIMWRYVGSALYFAVGVLCLAIGLFSPSPAIAILGLATATVGVVHFRWTYELELTRAVTRPPLDS